MEDCNVFIGDVRWYSEKDLREALGIAEDSDIFECIKYRDRQLEILRTEVAAARRMYNHAIKDRNYFGKRLADIRKAAGMADDDPSDLVKYVETLRRFEEEYEHLYKQYEKMYCELRDAKFTGLSEERDRYKKDDILKVYREIFDCSNGDPEGTDEETLQDILTEYKRVLELKNVAEEKTIKYKELARENEDKANKYKVRLGNIWDVMGKNLETQPGDDERLVGEVAELKRGEKLLIEFRDDVAKAIGMNYPTTNQVILNRVKYLYKDRGDAYEIVSKLNDRVAALEKAKEDLQQIFITSRYGSLEDSQQDLSELRKKAIEELKSRGFCFRPEENETLPEIYDKLLKRYDWAYGVYKEQYRLRQQWHVRYESEHERANGVQKALDREREACRVKDISLETAKKQYEKVCSNLETAEFALNGMKNKVRELQEELNAERHPNPTEDIETHPIDTDPGYLRSGEEDSEE